MNRGDMHIGEFGLRRHRAGETAGGDGERMSAHAASCGECRARLKALDDEQRRFEQEISFDRFAAGVERAARGARAARRRPAAVRPWMFSAVGLAAAAALVLVVAPRGREGLGGRNRIKGGGAGITVRVAAGDGPQRTASAEAPEALSPGESVRIGYEPGRRRYLLSLSIDERGRVTPLYPESGRSVPVGTGSPGAGAGAPRYLPDSVEFTDPGAERLIVILSDEPLEVEAARRAARAAYQRARGDVRHLPALELPGDQFHRTFIKP